jgi:RimJ/RimL family protein N-acetyltransferase
MRPRVQSSEIETERLLLRGWQNRDREPFARMNADPRVMEFFPALLTRAETDAMVARMEGHFRAHGLGLYAVELRQGHEFVGFAGLSVPTFQANFTPSVEIGWRLAAEHWGRGLATEAARAVVRRAFDTLDLDALVSFTTPANVRSRRVMEKIGMTHDPADDFDHPGLPAGHPWRRHVLYRLRRPASGRQAGTSF